MTFAGFRKLTVLVVSAALLAPAFAHAHDRQTRDARKKFDRVPERLYDHVARMQQIVSDSSSNSHLFRYGITQLGAEKILESISDSLPDLVIVYATYDQAPRDVRAQARETRRPIYLSRHRGEFTVLTDRMDLVQDESEALQATFVEIFDLKTSAFRTPEDLRRQMARALCRAAEEEPHPRYDRPTGIIRRTRPAVPTPPAPQATPPSPPPFPDFTPPAETERSRLQSEIENAGLRRELTAAKDDTRHLEADFQAWLSEHQQKDREQGIEADLKRRKFSGRYQVEHGEFNAPGGWVTGNRYGVGELHFHCEVCGKNLPVPERFRVLCPR